MWILYPHVNAQWERRGARFKIPRKENCKNIDFKKYFFDPFVYQEFVRLSCFYFIFLLFSILFFYICVLPVHMLVHHLHVWCLWRPEGGDRPCGTGVENCCVLLCGCWKSNSSSLVKQQVLLAAKPSLLPSYFLCVGTEYGGLRKSWDCFLFHPLPFRDWTQVFSKRIVNLNEVRSDTMQ